MTPVPTQTPDELLAKELAHYYADPLGFVMMAYPWKQPGTELEHEKGPDENQKRFLSDLGKEVAARAFNGIDPVMPILMTADLGSRHRQKRHGRLDRGLDPVDASGLDRHGDRWHVHAAWSRAPGRPYSTGPSCASPATGSTSRRAASFTSCGPRPGRSLRRPARRRTLRPSPASTRAPRRPGTCSTRRH